MRNFRLSADETKIAYSDALNGQTDIWLIENGQRRQLTNTKDEETRLAWHPDGKRILFTASRDGHYQIDVANVDGKTVEQVTRGDGEYELIDVSADGAKIFYRSWEDKSDVWSVKLENGEETDVASEPESEFWPAVSPDGQWIAYQTNSNPAPFRVLQKSSITVKSNKDGSKRLSIVGTHPQWLPDNRSLSFLRWNDETQKNELWVVDTNTGDEKLVANDPIPFPAGAPFPFNRAQVRDFTWSPDGTNVVYSVRTSGVKDLRMRNTHEGEVVALTNNQDPARSFLSPVWSPSGRRLAYVSQQKVVAKDQKPEWNVWLYENGRVKTIFTTSSSLRLLGWISEDQLLFEKCDGPMSSRLSDITLLKLSVSGEATTLFDVHDVYALSMVVSPNGKTVAYSARQNDKDNIWITDVTSGSQRKITANANSKLFFGSLSWTSDSKTVYFDKQEEINTISMIDNFK
jgi:Tol biopolymer transport system component